MEKEILLLNKIGLSDAESKVYLTLLQRGSLTGYEASKLAGIPRSKVYNILENLTQKGFILFAETENSNKYSALPIKQVVDKVQHETKGILSELDDRLGSFPITTNMDEIWHIKNKSNILTKCREMVLESKKELLLQIWEEDISFLLDALQEQEENELKMGIVVFSGNQNLELPLKKYSIHGMVEEKLSEMGGHWISVIADNQEVVFGQILCEDIAEVIWTKSRPMVFLASEYVKHDLYFYRSATLLKTEMEAAFGTDLEKIRDIF
ncbi:MAG: helix-turn-helix domain-containing protein [Eubacteriales bacterium]